MSFGNATALTYLPATHWVKRHTSLVTTDSSEIDTTQEFRDKFTELMITFKNSEGTTNDIKKLAKSIFEEFQIKGHFRICDVKNAEYEDNIYFTLTEDGEIVENSITFIKGNDDDDVEYIEAEEMIYNNQTYYVNQESGAIYDISDNEEQVDEIGIWDFDTGIPNLFKRAYPLRTF